MFGPLLILWKNGRTVEPYGVKNLNNNMSCAFLCIVIIISCSVSASGDLEIFPDQKFDLSSEEQRPNSYENPDGFYRRPLKRYYDYDEIKRDFGILEYLDKATKKESPPFYPNFDEIYDKDRKGLYPNIGEIYDKDRKGLLRKYILKELEKGRLLEESRPYPVEEDFSFHDENYEEEKGEDYPVTEEASGKGELENLKVVDDPALFAYPPSDPRFFQNQALDVAVKLKANQMKDNKVFIKNRSDGKFVTNSDVDNEDLGNVNSLEVVAVKPNIQNAESAGVYIIAIIAGISAAATVALIAVGIGWYNLQKHVKNASDVEYPAYGITGPNKDTSPSGDRRLAQSAQMYHYQHQKQQIIAMERAAAGERPASVSDAESDEENEEGDYTVYECPGLAPTGEMEVKNPLFQDDPTPAQTPQIKQNTEDKK